MVKYYQSMMGLQDEYYNSEALKLKNLADTMEAEYGRMSHVTLTRPSVDASEIQSAGYTTELTSSSVYAQSFGDETKQVILTPILPDGTILSPDALASYAERLLNGEKIDADIQLAVFEGDNAVKQTAEYINGLEKMQSEYQNLKKAFSESPYGDFTEEQLKAIEELTKAVEEILKEQKDIISSAKDLYKTSTDSVNDTMDKIIAFYAGMGTSVDGLDLTPDGTGVADGKVITVDTSVAGGNEIWEDIKDSTDEISSNTSKTAEILEKYGLEPVSPDKLWANFNPDLFNIAARQHETMINTKPYVAEYVTNRNEQQVVINNHYDSLINVEGSVDKSFSGQLKKDSDEIYKGVVNRLYDEVKMVTGRRTVRRSVL